MRPLSHPAIDDVTVEGILHALSDPVRVAIFAKIVDATAAASCTSCTSAVDQSIPKSTLSQHFKILREGGLIRSERRGVEILNTSRCQEIDRRFPGLLGAIVKAHQAQAAARGARKPKRTRTAKTDA